MRSIGKIVRRFLICVMVLGFFVPQDVYAIDRMDEERPVSLCVDLKGEKNNVDGTNVWLYKVADVSGFGEFELTEEFSKYPVVLENLDVEGWNILAETLESYILRDKIDSFDCAATDKMGMATFPAEQKEMSKGLYLVVCQNYIDDHQKYTYDPILICLPNRNMNDEWIYNEVIYPKDGPLDYKTELKVVKIWKDDATKRPEEIEVELLKDGEVYETVKLNKKNNWTKEWKLLEKGHEWKVVEKDVPEGYTVSISQDESAIVITNTSKTPVTPPKTPSKLPQTGVLWWPVPILAGAGMVFFMIGWVKRRRFGE